MRPSPQAPSAAPPRAAADTRAQFLAAHHSGPKRLGTQAVGFVVVGVAGTSAYLGLYLAFRSGMPAQAANVIARVVVAVFTTHAGLRVAFGARVSVRHVVATALTLLAVSTAISAGSLAVLAAVRPDASRADEVAALIAANLLGAALRFAALRQVGLRASSTTDGGEATGAAGT